MEWNEFREKYKSYTEEFNNQTYEERIRTSRLMAHDSIAELIRSKQHLKEAIKKINDRIKILSTQLDKDLTPTNHAR